MASKTKWSWRTSSKTSLNDWMWSNLTTDCGFLCLWLENFEGILLFWSNRGKFWKLLESLGKFGKFVQCESFLIQKIFWREFNLLEYSFENWLNEFTPKILEALENARVRMTTKSLPVFLLHHSWHFMQPFVVLILFWNARCSYFWAWNVLQYYVIYVLCENAENTENAMIISTF